MNHLKTFQRAAVVVLAMVAGFSNRLSAQTCPVSNEITITVIPEATITTAGATTICAGGNATLTATPGGGTGTCTLQWQSSTNGVLWTDIAGATNPTLNITALTATTSYHAVYTCSGSGCDVVTSNSQTVTVNPDLSVTADLTNITQCIGGNSQLSITTTGGSGGALTYTWEQSTNNSTWGAATGATNASTYTPSAATAGTMYYRVRVSDAVSGCDELTSATSTVVISPDLAISATLNPITECIGGNDALTVTTSGGTGGALTYVWEQSSDNSSWAGAAGATNAATYTPSSASAGTMHYRVRITDGANGCDAITATSTTVTVTPDLSITANLANITECIGGGDQLSITVTGGSGGAKVYTWEQSTDGSTGWTGATGATNASTYVPSSATAGLMYYRVRVTDAATGCDAITSATSTVTVTPDVSITANLVNITECIGGTDQLSITVTGGSGGAKVYTWEQSTDGSTGWTGAAGASNATTYTPAATAAGTMYYRVRVTDAATGCDAITSATSTVTVTPDMSITADLTNITECIGGTDQLSITVTGGSGGAKVYTWEESTNNSTWVAAAGATNTATYTPAATTAGTMYYRVSVTDAATGCGAVTSATSTVVVAPDMSITANLVNITECIDGTDQLSITVTGGSGGAKVYTWEQSTDGTSGWAAAAGASNATTYTPPATVAGTMYYRVSVTDAATGCGAITSAVSTTVVTPDMSITANLANITQCIGGGDQLSITVTGGSGGAKVYTWEESTNGTTGWTGAAGATNATTYTPSSATAGTMFYRVRVTDAATGCGAITSATSTVTITPDMSITANLSNITECVGGTNTLTITLTGGSGGALTYIWEESTTGTGGWAAAASATNAPTYQPSSATAGLMYYRVRVTDAATGCDAITSATSTVTITPDLTISTNLVDISECIGGTTALTVATSGGSGGALTYTWEQSTDNSTFVAATGATSSTTYTPSSTTAGIMYYRVTVADAASGCQSIVSAVSTVTINPDISISAQPVAITECISGTLSLSVTASGGTGALTYQWEESTDGSTYAAVPSATSATYIPPSTAAGVKYYRVAISNAGNGCQSITSTAATVTVIAKPTISVAASVTTVCVGGGTLLTATPANGTGTCTIQWQNSTDSGASWNDIPAANGTTYTTPALNSNTNYRAKYTCDGNGCCN